ncbi:MAG: hypothetical protein ABFS14_04125 [Gemmatimonadota bacterium]
MSLSTEYLKVLPVILVAAACYDIGEPTQSPVRVTWTAFPDTVPVGQTFSLEFAGPVTPNACGRLDTAAVAIGDSTIRLSGQRSVYDTMCSDSRVSFYEARPISLDDPGRFRVLDSEGRELGSVVALDSGTFSAVRTRGTGTLDEAGGCYLFGPGWLGNQRPFALAGLAESLKAEGGSDRVLFVAGTLHGFSLCGQYGSRPRIDVDTAYVTDQTIADYYPEKDTD